MLSSDMPCEVLALGTGNTRGVLCVGSSNGDQSGDRGTGEPQQIITVVEHGEVISYGDDAGRELEARAKLKLIQSGFEPDYFEIRDARSLQQVTEQTEEVAILAAAKLGKPRLIDNVRLNLNPVTDWGMLDHAGQSPGK